MPIAGRPDDADKRQRWKRDASTRAARAKSRRAARAGSRSKLLDTRPDLRDRTRPRKPVARRRFDGPLIDLRNVRKTYEMGNISVQALRGVSLQVQLGEFVAIMGASGSGKSTLMYILGCLDLPSSGSYRLNGLDVRRLDEDTLSDVRNRQIGFVFQSFNLIPRTTALRNVELPLMYAGVGRTERRQNALAALASVGLSDRVNHLPSELSGGQQQRVALARALVTNPAMILADEPTGNLDTVSAAEVLSIFKQLHSQGRTIVLITHEHDVAKHAPRLVRVRDGEIVGDEATEPTEVPA